MQFTNEYRGLLFIDKSRFAQYCRELAYTKRQNIQGEKFRRYSAILFVLQIM